MSIIYAPYIDDTIPAFTFSEVIIPFSQNPAVNWEDVKGILLTVKDLNSNLLTTIEAKSYNYNEKTKTGKIFFDISSSNLWQPLRLQYYKFQISYGYNKEDGSGNLILDGSGLAEVFYEDNISVASIGRCIGLGPIVQLSQVSIYQWQGECDYSNGGEPPYSYRFIITKSLINGDEEKVIKDTGWIIHNIDLDTSQKAIWLFNTGVYIANNNFKYTLYCTITTINGYETTITTELNVTEKQFKDVCVPGNLTFNQETGWACIKASDSVLNNLLRSSDGGNTWETILIGNNTTEIIDNTLESDIKYYYNIIDDYQNIQYIIPNFEEIFLSDESKQLKIVFNPKVSSFKNTILESKMDTIDSQYPFFFRNGTVKYKEIPISGLISYHMDPDELFMTKEELGLVNDTSLRVTTDGVPVAADLAYPSTQLTGANIAAERKFRLAVLEWLNNGQPKLFRSPTEGNYIVRLMNVSLSPNEQLGRMLYTFSATGYEMAPADIENLKKYNLFLTRE